MNELKLVINNHPVKSTVAEVFASIVDQVPLPQELASAPYKGSREQLLAVTEAVALVETRNFLKQTDKPTASYITASRTNLAQSWWRYLTEDIESGPAATDKSMRKAIEHRVKSIVDRVAHKFLTGHDLPPSKDGFSYNALQTLRKATGHGDAAIFLYRIRYWWPKAVIVHNNRKWIAKTHPQWAEELGMEERTFRTAYSRLLELDLIEAARAKFNGATVNHIRPTETAEKLFAAVKSEGTN